MTVLNFIGELTKLDPAKPIKIVAPNGLLLDPKIKHELKDYTDILNHGADNIESYVITWGG